MSISQTFRWHITCSCFLYFLSLCTEHVLPIFLCWLAKWIAHVESERLEPMSRRKRAYKFATLPTASQVDKVQILYIILVPLYMSPESPSFTFFVIQNFDSLHHSFPHLPLPCEFPLNDRLLFFFSFKYNIGYTFIFFSYKLSQINS